LRSRRLYKKNMKPLRKNIDRSVRGKKLSEKVRAIARRAILSKEAVTPSERGHEDLGSTEPRRRGVLSKGKKF